MDILNDFNTLTSVKNWSTIFKLKALRLKTHYFNTKLPYQKPILRQIELWVQNGPITKNRVLPVTTLFFGNFFPVLEPLKKSLFDVPATQMSMFVFFVSAGV